MEKIRGFAVILLCLALGNLLSLLTGIPVPGSVFGMLFLLILLLTKRVRLETVEPAASLLIGLLLLFILPGAVNLMNIMDKFAGVIPQMLLILLLTTLATMAASALVTQRLSERRRKKGGGDHS